mgnify:CR=1 FL=1
MKRRHDHGVQKVMAFLLAFVFTSVFPYGGVNVKADTTENGLILYYDFDMQNSYATEITDASGNGHTGTLKRAGGGSVEGTYKISTVNIYGNSVKALTLPGGEDGSYLQLPNAILNGNDAVTISMWVNLSTDTGYQRIWDIGNDTTSYLYLLSDGGNKGHEGYAAAITKSGWSNEVGVEKKTKFDKNRWVLTTVVMDGTQMSLYENGKQIGETTDTKISVNDLGATTNNLIGYGQFGDNPTKGQFAEVKIYNKALSADEIAAMYSVDDAGIVAADKDALDLGDTTAVTEDITLPAKGVNGSAITWESTNSAITIADGIAKVTRPAIGNENVSGTLTATVTSGSEKVVKKFAYTVIALKESVSLKDVEEINVTTLKGHSPSLPNYVKATYTDGSVNKIKAVWPASIEADKYANTGNFDVEGSLTCHSCR